ncbi:MFS transporter [Streptomyces sp. NPDC058268]|uniref:MFS transporter n=1 Tax=Streptomyces sp. NPDC058268 TaxID=3346413 RepID=UPI0036E261E4
MSQIPAPGTEAPRPLSAQDAPPSLWRHRSFRLYLVGEATSVAGSSVSSVALPVLAVVDLHASTSQVGLLALLGQLPNLLVALHAGALADRYRKRRLMIAGDVVCCLSLVTVPIAAYFNVLSLGWLMAVAVIQSTASVVHDAASISYLPHLVDRSLLQRGNSRIGALFSVSATAGANLGAMLTGALGAARAVTADTFSYVISAWCIWRIRTPEPAPQPQTGSLSADIPEGIRYVFGDTTLRTLTLTNSTTSFALAIMNTLWALYLLRDLAFSALALGVVMGGAALGSCVGALLAPRWSKRVGPGPMMLVALALTPLMQLPLLMAGPGRPWQVIIAIALSVQLCCAGAAGTTQRTIRQMVAKGRLQGRMQAVSSWLTGGSRPLAAALATGLGTWLGVRATLGVGALLLIVPFLVLWFSPLRTLSTVPSVTANAPVAAEGTA